MVYAFVQDVAATWQRYQAKRLEPVIATLGGPAAPEPLLGDLHPGHVVIRTTTTQTTREGARR